MAAAQTLDTTSAALDVLRPREIADVDLRLAIHDTSRLEWAVSVPLPRAGQSDYAIEVDLEVPAHVLAPHSPWDHLQELARLDGAEDSAPAITTVDGLRRFAVGVAAKMARAHEGFGRHARLILSPFATGDVTPHFAALGSWVIAAEKILASARDRLGDVPGQLDIAREARLVDEYLSLRLLELLAGAESTLATVLDRVELATPEEKHLAIAKPHVLEVGDAIADALVREMDQRAACDYPEADADSPQRIERYLDRASQLKKHFQEVLFLEAHRYAVNDRLHHWASSAAAVLAGTFAFIVQLYIARGSTTARLSSGIVAACIIAGVSYAVRDRVKEVGRVWFTSGVHRFYAQRIARYRAPAKTCPSRDVIVRAKESFLRENGRRADPLNPASGATVPITTLRYRHQGTLESSHALNTAGISRVKHVFRYDLSPLFARLDDATKPVPILDAQTHRVRFKQAPRCYRVPVRLVVRVGGVVTSEQAGAIIVHKRGLERIELD